MVNRSVVTWDVESAHSVVEEAKGGNFLGHIISLSLAAAVYSAIGVSFFVQVGCVVFYLLQALGCVV